ncbi:hypothetical protein LY39_00767 [Roseinatronobacter bogoriensis subsp. barguzinensis]|nr:hypothetical protein [Rhodobaca bogoriensis DSM 18756]TDW41659.1 hypothetical protein LY39_00767 [Rhodobaca barguzinensis]TDY74162.1 hypothetical protein EV660_101197 [Rhodobaca bogoriensis DSM 18756]
MRRRASPGRPRARRFGCHLRIALILCGFGQHKPPQIESLIAAPRPGNARRIGPRVSATGLLMRVKARNHHLARAAIIAHGQ